MFFPLYIAKRYLFARKSQNVINIITAVSIIGVAVGTAGLVIVLSVFNGFGDLVLSLYDSFDPDIKITAAKGKSFNPEDANINAIKKIKGIRSINEIVEENVLLRYRDRQVIARIKGVDSGFVKNTKMSSSIIDGDFVLQQGDTNYAVFGSGVAYYLSMDVQHIFAPVQLFVPKRGKEPTLNPDEAFNRDWIIPSGVFALQQDFDNKYVFVPIAFARKLFDMPVTVNSLEVSVDHNVDIDAIQSQIRAEVGENLIVKTRAEQHDFLYKILSSEKYVAYFILCLILLIATFNILGSLTMLIIEKKHDIGLLMSLGSDLSQIKYIFLTEGFLITFIGAFSGLVLGGLVCVLQKTFGFIAIEDAESFVVDSYPVAMQTIDFLLSFLIVIIIGATASYYTAQKLVSKYSLSSFK